jgi:hypothetical protein
VKALKVIRASGLLGFSLPGDFFNNIGIDTPSFEFLMVGLWGYVYTHYRENGILVSVFRILCTNIFSKFCFCFWCWSIACSRQGWSPLLSCHDLPR